ncbi:hypothetical protein AB9P05_11020 [Roseivirga sp. BDSF3-8]|uniref:hypothetical protein n=1 Tax=Roseivirga sp. BDSF3-8 TaxID=3241598 RepID=UPI003531BBD0
MFPVLYVSTWLIILFIIPREVYYSRANTNLTGWGVFALIFLLLPYFLSRSLAYTGLPGKVAKGISLSSVFPGIPFVFWLSDVEEREQ